MPRQALQTCKLWWPEWQQGIPFTSYGYTNTVSGPRYQFNVCPELDSWLCDDGSIMPMAEAKLCDVDEGPIDYTSFTILGDVVQVNNRKYGGYTVEYYTLRTLYFEGPTYEKGDE